MYQLELSELIPSMYSRRTGVTGLLRGREMGFEPTFDDRSWLSTLLYSSNTVENMWDPTNMPSQESHGGIFNFDFSSDGSALVAACEKKSFLVFDPHNCKLVNTRKRAHRDCVNCIRFLDTRSFVTCSDDTTVTLWDLRFLKNKVRTFEVHTNWVKNIEYASSQGTLITSGFDGSVYSWNINKQEEPKRLFHLEGLMRCKLTPDESKLVLSTSQGYMLIVHDLDLASLCINMDSFKAGNSTGSRLRMIVNNFSGMFKRTKNRLEIVNDFPVGDDADSIASLQIHPHGWCAVSRNTNASESSEWTCVHDIHTHPVLKDEEEDTDMSPEDPSLSPTGSGEGAVSCARTNPPPLALWGTFPSRRPGLSSGRPVYQRALVQDLRNVRDVMTPSTDGQSAPVENSRNAMDVDSDQAGPFQRRSDRALNRELDRLDDMPTDSSTDDDDDDAIYRNEYELSSNSASESDSSAVDTEDSANGNPLWNLSQINNNLYRYFVWTQMAINMRRRWFSLDDYLPTRRQRVRSGQDRQNGEEDDRMEHAIRFIQDARQRHEREPSVNEVSFNTSGFLFSPVPGGIYHSQPRLIYAQKELNVGRGFIKEQCFSSDGRVIVSPCGDGVCLLSFDNRCRELCDCEPPLSGKPRILHRLKSLTAHSSVVLTTCCSPTRPLFVSGSLDGSVAFISPNL